MGLLSEEQRNEVLEYGKSHNIKFLDAVRKLKLVSDKTLKKAFGVDWKTDLVALTPDKVPLSTLYIYEPEFLITYGFLPLGFRKNPEGTYAVVGMLTPKDLGSIEFLAQKLKHPVKTVLISAVDLIDILENVYKIDLEKFIEDRYNLVHPHLLRHIVRKLKRPDKGRIQHSLNVIKVETKDEKTSKKKISLESGVIQMEDFTKETDPYPKRRHKAKSIKKQTLPGALAYRVFPPNPEEHHKVKEESITPKDRRKRKRKKPDEEYLLGLKIRSPKQTKEFRRRGIIRQFYIDNFSQEGMFLSGNRIDDLEIGSVFEFVFSSPWKDSKDAMDSSPLHFSMMGKLIRMEKETDGVRRIGIGIQILKVSADYIPYWLQISKAA
jgi:hypothetical protein